MPRQASAVESSGPMRDRICTEVQILLSRGDSGWPIPHLQCPKKVLDFTTVPRGYVPTRRPAIGATES